MIVNKGLKVILSLVMAVSLLIPFNIHADTLTDANIVGYNFEVGGSTILATRERSVAGGTITDYNRQINYNCTVIFDDNYIGNVTVNFRYYWYQQNSDNTISNSSSNQVRTLYLDGNSATFSFGLVTWYNADPLVTQSGLTISPSLNITASNVVVKDMNADTLKKWNVPVESMMFNLYQMNNQREIVTFYDNNNFSIPIYKVNAGDKIYEFASTNNTSNIFSSYTVVLGISSSFGNSLINTYFGKRDGSFVDTENLYRAYVGNMYNGHNGYFQVMKFKITNFTGNSSGSNINYLSSNYDLYIIPIYFSTTSNNYISTEFALQYGLTNSMLDNIEKIANGTTASQSAAVDSQTANSQLQTSSNQLFTQEDTFKSDMNNAMQNIPSFSVNNFGSKFMTSATWVRQQYERMTNNTPFQQVITFSLMVGLSMILIGKVRK